VRRLRRLRSFAQSPIARSLDILGERYKVRPSQIMGYSPDEGLAVMYDLAIARHAIEEENKAQSTTGGKIMAKRQGWDPEILKEIEEAKQLGSG